MTTELPAPGSIWRNTKLNRQMRVIFSGESEIVAHDAELSDKLEHIVSWVGNADQFNEIFEPGDETKFPQTAYV